MSTQPTGAEIDALWRFEASKNWDSTMAMRISFARAVLAKWGQPVVAGEPYAYAVYFPDQPCEELVHDLDDLTEDLTNREHTITELYTTPQPTQSQAGAAPLTPERLREIERMCVYANTATLIDFARAIERAHGIKGGQHGADT